MAQQFQRRQIPGRESSSAPAFATCCEGFCNHEDPWAYCQGEGGREYPKACLSRQSLLPSSTCYSNFPYGIRLLKHYKGHHKGYCTVRVPQGFCKCFPSAEYQRWSRSAKIPGKGTLTKTYVGFVGYKTKFLYGAQALPARRTGSDKGFG